MASNVSKLSPSGAAMIAGGMAGMAVWTVTLPIDAVKTLLQTGIQQIINQSELLQ
jgi:hypothetical protein